VAVVVALPLPQRTRVRAAADLLGEDEHVAAAEAPGALVIDLAVDPAEVAAEALARVDQAVVGVLRSGPAVVGARSDVAGLAEGPALVAHAALLVALLLGQAAFA